MSRLFMVVGIVLWLLGIGALVWAGMVGWAAQSAVHELYAAILFLSFVTSIGLGTLLLAAAWLVPRFDRLVAETGRTGEG